MSETERHIRSLMKLINRRLVDLGVQEGLDNLLRMRPEEVFARIAPQTDTNELLYLRNWFIHEFGEERAKYLGTLTHETYLGCETPARKNATTPREIVRLPGHRLRELVDFLYSPKTVAEVFQPILTDLAEEWYEAIIENRTKKAIWIRIRNYWAFSKAAGLLPLLQLISKVYGSISR